jgi:heterodisulfide reductase subunit D
MSDPMPIPTMAEMAAQGETPEVLFWVGCMGAFDDRARKITKAFVRILHAARVKFAVLGQEEGCTGDPARRAGNEFLFQMQALQNVTLLNGYGVKRIVTACPHCFNTIRNEYPALGGSYEVMHHTQFINALLKEGRIKVEGGAFKGNASPSTIPATWDAATANTKPRVRCC